MQILLACGGGGFVVDFGEELLEGDCGAGRTVFGLVSYSVRLDICAR